MQHYTVCFSITKVFHALQKCFKHYILFHVSNKVGKARIGQRVDTIRISSFSLWYNHLNKSEFIEVIRDIRN